MQRPWTGSPRAGKQANHHLDQHQRKMVKGEKAKSGWKRQRA